MPLDHKLISMVQIREISRQMPKLHFHDVLWRRKTSDWSFKCWGMSIMKYPGSMSVKTNMTASSVSRDLFFPHVPSRPEDCFMMRRKGVSSGTSHHSSIAHSPLCRVWFQVTSQCEMTALLSWIFWFHFCTMGGSNHPFLMSGAWNSPCKSNQFVCS